MTALDWLRFGAEAVGLIADIVRSPADSKVELRRVRLEVQRRHDELLRWAEEQKQRRPRR